MRRTNWAAPAAGILVAGVLLISARSYAAEASPEVITVTGTRPLAPVGQAAFSRVTLDADALSQSDRLDAALQAVPGLSLFRRSTSLSANPTTQGMSLRSIAPSGAGRALVLLDGIPLNDPFGGWVIWSQLTWEDIESAEIVRGAGSGPYGAGALTGTISLLERRADDGTVMDASTGSLASVRAGVSGGTTLGGVSFFAHAAGERSNGWIPVQPPQRGRADNHLWLDSGSASLRADTQVNGVAVSARVGTYADARGSGLAGAESRTHGLTASLAFAEPGGEGRMGWRAQAWVINSGLSNISVSVPLSRAFTTPANDQYATPALGIGFNAAATGKSGPWRWEFGSDLRANSGESRELFSFSAGQFQNRRRSGGKQTIGGVYAEIAYAQGGWLVTGGVRGDYWSTAQGHLLNQVRASSAVLLRRDYAGRDGTVPTGRLAVRKDFVSGLYARLAAYAGFRAPSLNELYRPFRVGNDQTNANAGLRPEKLYGIETGLGGTWDRVDWNATLFFNQLDDAIANVTCNVPPFSCTGAPPSGGVLRQRMNAGNIAALGLEADARLKIAETLDLRAALSLTNAKFVSGQLDGKRPAQAPRATVTAGLDWRPLHDISFSADLRMESMRFEDDLNSLRLGSGLTVDLRGTWAFAQRWSVYLGVNNAADADVATGESTTHVISYAAPRVTEIGLVYRP